MTSPQACLWGVRRILSEEETTRYDVIVIDGLYRRELCELAISAVAEDGMTSATMPKAMAFTGRSEKAG